MHHSSSAGQFIFFLIVVVISILSRLFAQKKENGNSAPPKIDWDEKPAPSRPRPQYQQPQTPASEDERVRQFMDALGLPANTPPPIRRAAAPQAQTPPPLTANFPPRPKTAVSETAPLPVVFRQDSPSVQAWQQREKEVRDIAQNWNAQLQRKTTVSGARNFETSSASSVSSQPTQQPQSSSSSQPEMAVSGSAQVVQRLVERQGKQIVAQPASPLATAGGFDVRALMRSRDGLRAAFLMQQIFGAPKGLQS